MSKKILIIEDELTQREILSEYLTHRGYRVFSADFGGIGLEYIKRYEPDIVLLDYKLPDVDGLKLLKDIKRDFPLTPVIIITAFGSIERAVEAMQAGAYTYLTKPINLKELLINIKKALKEAYLVQEVKRLKEQLKDQDFGEGIIAHSRKMKDVLVLAKKVADTDATVLILGESGTGKNLLAHFIHRFSLRSSRPFISINCAAIPPTLLESELFGYVKGAFTGAYRDKPGLFKSADTGTIFLDEIGDIPLELQAKLLRVIQDNSFTPLGSVKEVKVDVRIISATNRDLDKMIEENRFREDLYWRLKVFTIIMPPLRERREDIRPLVEHFLSIFNSKYKKSIAGFSKKALQFLLTYDYPGNVRELENMIERAVVISDDEVIDMETLTINSKPKDHMTLPLFSLPLSEAVAHLEKIRIKEAMEQAGGVKTRAARVLGISERVLRYKLNRYGLEEE